MTGGRFLLLFADEGGGWWRLRDGAVIARGDAWPGAAEEERVVLIVSGADVALHWVDLPALAPRQALAAARLLAAEKSAEPVDRLHIALGQAEEEPRPLALVSVDRMRGWLDGAATAGIDPDHVVPAPLLLPSSGEVVRWERGGQHNVRGPHLAFAAEPGLAEIVMPDGKALDDKAIEAGLDAALASMPLDLRQGVFAKRRRWRPEGDLVRRLALIAAACLLVALAIPLILLLKTSFAADRIEGEARTVARSALPRGAADAADPSAALAARLAGLRGGGAGFTATAATLFAAVRDTANVELAGLRFGKDGTLRATVEAGTARDIDALARRIEADGFAVGQGEAQPGGGRQIGELTMRPR